MLKAWKGGYFLGGQIAHADCVVATGPSLGTCCRPFGRRSGFLLLPSFGSLLVRDELLYNVVRGVLAFRDEFWERDSLVEVVFESGGGQFSNYNICGVAEMVLIPATENLLGWGFIRV